ncbi:hypothetical protein QE152_g7972 [Popillia japonica]|uniref:PHD-type domain-containing protein n=1 Tax=Popillia japonica TaxID=7064 RepID=A0AAW1MDF9_POPJA
MPSTCKICTQIINKKSPGLQCSGSCAKFFHARCVNIPSSAVAVFASPGSSWKCPDCRTDLDASACGTRFLEDDSEIDVGAPNLTAIYRVLQNIQGDIKSINSKYSTLMESVNFCSDKVSEFEKVLSELSKKCQSMGKIEKENASLKQEIGELRNQIQDLEQHKIQGVPQRDNENIFDILHKIGDAIQCDISPTDINAAHRVAQLNQPNRISILTPLIE